MVSIERSISSPLGPMKRLSEVTWVIFAFIVLLLCCRRFSPKMACQKTLNFFHVWILNSKCSEILSQFIQPGRTQGSNIQKDGSLQLEENLKQNAEGRAGVKYLAPCRRSGYLPIQVLSWEEKNPKVEKLQWKGWNMYGFWNFVSFPMSWSWPSLPKEFSSV